MTKDHPNSKDTLREAMLDVVERIGDVSYAWKCPRCGRKHNEYASLTGVLGNPLCNKGHTVTPMIRA